MSWQHNVERTVTGLGLELVELERSAGGLLRVYIDRPLRADGAEDFVTVDDCERVTRQLQSLLEVEAVDYARLEVSSPGLDRPLKTPAHFQRFAGLDIDITLRLPFQGRKKYRGRLQAAAAPETGAAGDAAALAWSLVFGESGQEQVLTFQLDELRDARLVPVIDFKGRKAKPAAPSANEKLDGDLTP